MRPRDDEPSLCPGIQNRREDRQRRQRALRVKSSGSGVTGLVPLERGTRNLEPLSLCRCYSVNWHRNEKVFLVPDEIALVVDGELVILAHENRRHGTGFFAVAAEDAARLVDLVRDCVSRP